MFQLIVAVVSISLVVILAVAMLWYGGSAFTASSDRALFARLMNHGGQIEGAIQLYSSTRGAPPQGNSSQILATLLSENYLSTVPPGGWYVDGTRVFYTLDDFSVCRRMNQLANWDVSPTGPPAAWDGCPPCSDDSFSQWPGCRRPSP